MKLLVSVRSAAEANVALAAGVDLLDLKEPSAGALGGTEPAVWSEVCRLAAGRVPVSAAMGELADWHTESFIAERSHASGLAFSKIGLAGMQHHDDWPARWCQFAESLPAGVQPVAVAYADHRAAAAPSVTEVVNQAIDLGWNAVLIDTFDKRSGGLLDHLQLAEIERIISRLRSCRIMTVLAGSLDLDAIELLGRLANCPDYIGVRGAACKEGRTSSVTAEKIMQIRERFKVSQTASCEVAHS